MAFSEAISLDDAMADPHQIAGHYETGTILERILDGLRASGIDPAEPRPEDLKPVDEFHIGGLLATEALLEPLGITEKMFGLDVGSGIGGTSRYIAQRYGARMQGIDLTPAFVEVANTLDNLCGVSGRVSSRVGNALDMSVESGSFDFATLFHVGMNIENKPALFREVARALKPGGRFAIYEVMADGPGEITYPVPWSSAPETSHVVAPKAYREAAESAGLDLLRERDRSAFAVEFLRGAIAATKETGPPPLGLHILMGDTARERYGNMAKAVFDGVIAPWEMVFRKPD